MTLPAPGWYPDRVTPGNLRWWDGQNWTQHVAVPSYPAAPYRPPRPHPEAPARPAGPAAPPIPGAGWGPSPPPRGLTLDRAVSRLKAEDPAPWGVAPVLVPLVTIVVLIVAGIGVASLAPTLHGDAAIAFAVGLNLGVQGLLALSIYLAGRPVARRVGGWARAFGWRRPRWRDLGMGLAGVVSAYLIRLAFGAIMAAFTGPRAAEQSSNVPSIPHTFIAVGLLVTLTVVLAPITEELVFRGILLRSFMRRLSFWPAALLSTVIFAAFHTYEVATVLGAFTLAVSVGILGLVNCVLNRYTDSLIPGMYVHATLNALAVIVALSLH